MRTDTMITIRGDSIYVQEFKEGYNIPIVDFVKKYSKEVVTLFETPELPTGTIKYAHKAGIDYYYIHVPMGYYNFSDRGRTVEVLMPHTLFKFSMKGKVIQNDKITWSFDEKFNLNSKKFVYIPMQNIYDSRNVCIGAFNGGTTQKDKIEGFMTAFFENKFNGDLNKGDGSYLTQISEDQKLMRKDGHSEKEMLQRWFNLYDPDKKKLSTAKCYSKFMGLVEVYGTYKSQFGDF